MSDWQKGDLALCVSDSRLRALKIKRGCVYTVDAVGAPRKHMDFGLVVPLYLEGVDDPYGHAANRFIKVTPPKQETEEHRTEEVAV